MNMNIIDTSRFPRKRMPDRAVVHEIAPPDAPKYVTLQFSYEGLRSHDACMKIIVDEYGDLGAISYTVITPNDEQQFAEFSDKRCPDMGCVLQSTRKSGRFDVVFGFKDFADVESALKAIKEAYDIPIKTECYREVKDLGGHLTIPMVGSAS